MKKDVKVATTEKSIDISLKYKKVFGSTEGKVVLMDFIKRCGILACPNTSDEKELNTNKIMIEQGRKSAAIQLLKILDINVEELLRQLESLKTYENKFYVEQDKKEILK